jgi:hypothetical protein
LGDPELEIYTDKPVVVLNPIEEDIYEGQNVSINIKNIHNESTPNARICITSDNKLYRTLYADNEGNCNFIIPALKDKEYKIVITGHNVISSHFNFTTHLDTIKPEIEVLNMIQEKTNEIDTITFSAKAYDLYSGIENVFILLSKNDFEDFLILPMRKNDLDENYISELFNDNLLPGKYSYLAIARDFANNTNIIYDESFNFEVIGENQKDYIFLIYFLIIFSIIGLIGISIFLIYRKYQRKIAKKREWELPAVKIRKKERMDKLRKKKKLN